MRLLFVSESVYGSPQGATTLALAHLNLLENIYGADAIDVCCVDLEKTFDSACNKARLAILPTASKLHRLVNAASGRMYFLSRTAEDKMVDLAVYGDYDAVWFDCAMYGNAADRIRDQRPQIAIVTFYQFMAVQRYYQIYLESHDLPKLLYHYAFSVPQELQHLRASDVNYVMTSRDRQLFNSLCGEFDCCLLPMMVDDSFDTSKQQRTREGAEEIVLLFVGSAYWPNVEGIRWFVRNVMTELSSMYSLKIVGRGLEKLDAELGAIEGIDVIGACESVADWYLKADLVVAPILHGDGMKTKVAEALMFGRRVLGSSEALVGYEDSTCILCETPEDYIREIGKCVERGDLGYRFDARADFEAHYSSKTLGVRVSEAIDHSIRRRKER